MKKRTVIFMLIAMSLLFIAGCSNNVSVVYDSKDLSLMDDVFYDEENYYEEYISNDESVNYDLFSLSEYVKYFHFILNYERSYFSFTEEERAAIISFAAGLSYPQSYEHVKNVAKRYFNIDDYHLATGKYSVVGTGDLSGEMWCVTEKDGFYLSSIQPRGIDTDKIIDFYDFKINDTKIELLGRLIVENISDDANKSCVYGDETMDDVCYKGYYTYNLEKIGTSVIINSIIYRANDNFNPGASVSLH